ncbi:hypothetical protein [Palleronia sp. LCG004]|uniref:hypothetical protein n=1 Tax=Palleronia sp. LCG004 TaxID=3079304 RepID=UPI00294397C7|nr:hypothetical protein [Palleronia sp. LCG004]WOI58085.1 hypothetical protein RVY76_17250 [Palleronia sp. LCG004]
MGKLVTGAIGLVIGLVIGAIFGGALKIGAAAGVGAATGIGAGICSTVIAAQEEGLLTPEEIDRVLNRAARDMATTADDLDGEIVGSAAECEATMDRLRAATK